MASERNKFSSMWVVEWFHKASGEWTAVEGDTKLARARSFMRKWREDTHFFKTGDKFRIAKYVRAGRG